MFCEVVVVKLKVVLVFVGQVVLMTVMVDHSVGFSVQLAVRVWFSVG